MSRISNTRMIVLGTWVLACVITFSNTSLALPGKTQENLNQIMTEIGKTMVEIYPLVVANRKLTSAETESITHALLQLSNLFAAAKPFINLKSDGYQISYEFVSEYLKVVKSVLENYPVDYARGYLYALGEICASCHTQDSTLRTLFSSTARDNFDNDYAYAEFNYMTRNYGEAIKYYDKFLATPEKKTELEIIQPLQRIITVYTQVNNRPADGITHLQKYLNLKDHTTETKIQLENWIHGLKELNMISVQGNRPVAFNELKQYVSEYLGNLDDLIMSNQWNADQEVQRVWLRGQLYHYLNRNPDASETPIILYWLAVVDRSIAYNFYFSMTDLYLKQCVLKYPKHPYARRCYQEYREYIDYTYTRNGDPIPEGIKNEIREIVLKLFGTNK